MRSRILGLLAVGLLAVGLLAGPIATAHAGYLYTFSRTGADPYSFSFASPAILTTSMDLAVTPISAGGFTFNDARFTTSPGFACFAFGDGTTDATDSCGLVNPNGVTGIIVTFDEPFAVGVYPVLSTYSSPAGRAIDLLEISGVPEPGTLALLGLGLAGLGLGRRRVAHRPSAAAS